MTALLFIAVLAADAGTPSPSPARAPKVAFVLATPEAEVEKWASVAPSQRNQQRGALGKIKIGARAQGVIFLDGYQLSRSRVVDLTADVMITDSTGRIVEERASAAMARTWDPKNMSAVLLTPSVPLMFGLVDPEGTYEVTVTVWDQVRGESYRLKTSFVVAR